MLTDHDVKYLLRQWAAALDADERTRVANELKIQLPDGGTPVDAHCMDGAGNQIGLLGAWVERRAGLTDGGVQFAVSLPEEAEGAEVKRLILHGPRQDGSMGYAAIPMDTVAGGKVEVRLSEKAVRNCPINLDQATVAGVELVPLPWFARLLANGAEIVHVARSVWDSLNSWLEEVRGPATGVPAPGLARGDTRAAFPEEQQHEFDDGTLITRWLATHKGEVLITFEAKDDELEGQVITFPVNVTTLTGERITEAYLVLTKREPDAAPSATIRLHSLDEMAIEQDRVPAVTEELVWEPEHLPALQWSLERVQTTAGQEKLRFIIQTVEQLQEPLVTEVWMPLDAPASWFVTPQEQAVLMAACDAGERTWMSPEFPLLEEDRVARREWGYPTMCVRVDPASGTIRGVTVQTEREGEMERAFSFVTPQGTAIAGEQSEDGDEWHFDFEQAPRPLTTTDLQACSIRGRQSRRR